MSNWKQDLNMEEQAVVEYFRQTHPTYSTCQSFEEIKYQMLTPAECVEIIKIYEKLRFV